MRGWRKEIRIGGEARRRRFRLTARLALWGRDRVEFEGCFLTRRHVSRGETRGEHLSGLAPVLAAQESQNLRARSQRRSYGFAARRTPGWKADNRREGAADTATRFSSLLKVSSDSRPKKLEGGRGAWMPRLATMRQYLRLRRPVPGRNESGPEVVWPSDVVRGQRE